MIFNTENMSYNAASYNVAAFKTSLYSTFTNWNIISQLLMSSESHMVLCSTGTTSLQQIE